MGSEVVQLSVGIVTFIAVSALLGAADYGRYASAIAVFTIVGAIARLGAGQLLIRRLARPHEHDQPWETAIASVLLGTMAATVLVVLAQPILLPWIDRPTAAALGLSEVVFGGLVALSVEASQGLKVLPAGMAVRTIAATCRLGALVALLVVGPSVEAWAICLAVAASVAAIASLVVVNKQLSLAAAVRRPRLADIRAGLPFAVNQSSDSVMQDVDKAILEGANIGPVAGPYAAAYRLIGYGLLPIRGVIRASYADLFVKAEHDLGAAIAYLRKLSKPALGYGLLVAVGVFVAAPLLPIILGEDYALAVPMARALALVPPIKATQTLAANTLTAAGRNGTRNILLGVAATGNLLANAVAIPRYGWGAAVVSTIAAEMFLTAALWMMLSYYARHDRRRSRR
jgi:O-antigen/teichoic acid export membrane protein